MTAQELFQAFFDKVGLLIMVAVGILLLVIVFLVVLTIIRMCIGIKKMKKSIDKANGKNAASPPVKARKKINHRVPAKKKTIQKKK